MSELNQILLIDFQNTFTIALSSEFAMKWWLKVQFHLKRFAILPCEILIKF